MVECITYYITMSHYDGIQLDVYTFLHYCIDILFLFWYKDILYNIEMMITLSNVCQMKI